MFGSHWSSASGDETYFICQVTSQDHLIGRPCDSMSGGSSLYVITQQGLMAMGIVIGDI